MKYIVNQIIFKINCKNKIMDIAFSGEAKKKRVATK